MEIEQWRDVQGYEDHYQISSLGRVRSKDVHGNRCPTCNRTSKKKGRIRKLAVNTGGYLAVSLGKGESSKNHRVHRLVALHFVPRVDGKPEVNHKDGDKVNNRADNLEWVTNLENIQHAVRLGLHGKRKRAA
jgi:hypothetical protein